MTSALEGKVIAITGAARGIGAELARQSAARGARVALLGMEGARLAAIAAQLGARHMWAECDVTDQRALADAFDRVRATLGGIDIVVANAGIASRGPVATSPIEAQVRVVEVNLIGVMRTVHVALPHLVSSRGYILLISSAAAFAAAPGMAPYAASKAGVEQFGNVLRTEAASLGVAVGVAHPSWVDTDLVRDAQRDMPSFASALRQLPGPLGRVTDVEGCVAVLVDGIERRARRIYVPASLRWVAFARSVFVTEWAERLAARTGARHSEGAEREARATGREFGETSVGFGHRKHVNEKP